MVYHTNEHTHFPHSGATPSTIDLLLTNSHITFDLLAYTEHLSSDHAPIVCKLLGKTSTAEITPKFNFQRANWTKYQSFINRHLSSNQIIDTIPTIDSEIEHISTTIISAQQHSIPIKQFHSNHTKITHHTKNLIRDKNIMKRQWQRCNDLQTKRRLKTEINRMQREISHQLKLAEDLAWNKLLCRFQKGSKHFWDLAKKAKGNRKPTIDKLKVNSIPVTDDTAKANLLANVFKDAHTITTNYSHPNDEIVNECIRANNLVPRITNNAFDISTVSIQNIIGSLRPFKSPGPDGIPNILIKKLPLPAIQKITDIFNACVRLNYWPTNFKLAKVIPILKSGKDPAAASSYRPISLLNSIGKIFEKTIYNFLDDFATKNNIIPKYQFGFKRGHSTTHQVKRLISFINKNKAKKKSTGVILLDIEKAFDSIWHNGLIYKLIQLKFPFTLWKLIESFIKNRQFSVFVGDSKSNKINIPAGLAQGTALSPFLFSIFIADLPIPTDTDLALYADDTAIISSAKQSNTIMRRLNFALVSIQNYFNKWKIKVNITKTQAILFPFDNRKRRIPTTQLFNENQHIQLQKSVKYLGITLDSKLKFAQHIDDAVTKANKCFRAFFSLMTPNSSLSIDNKRLLYTSAIRPILVYGCSIWANAAYCHLSKMFKLQNKILKTIFGLHRRFSTALLHNHCGVEHLMHFIERFNANFNLRCSSSTFDLIRALAN